MIIDGSFGEGGGQILRTALSLSLLTGKSFRLIKLRANREKPGLRAQHLAAVRAALTISGSQAKGAELGSQELIFDPGLAKPGHYQIEIGTAGSTSLVFQTLLPALLNLERESHLEITGGTHNPKSPCFDFLQSCFIPLLNLIGIEVESEIFRHGFYPKGGGRVKFKIHPWRNKTALDLIEPVRWSGPKADILLAGLPRHIAEREREELMGRLNIVSDRVELKFLPPEQGPGNVILLKYLSPVRAEIFAGYGEKGKAAERVAQEVAREARNFSRSKAQLDPLLADQILLYLSLSSGAFTTNFLSSHFHTNLQILKLFLNFDSEIKSPAPDLHLVQFRNCQTGLNLLTSRLGGSNEG